MNEVNFLEVLAGLLALFLVLLLVYTIGYTKAEEAMRERIREIDRGWARTMELLGADAAASRSVANQLTQEILRMKKAGYEPQPAVMEDERPWVLTDELEMEIEEKRRKAKLEPSEFPRIHLSD